jgi:hypothetical protein
VTIPESGRLPAITAAVTFVRYSDCGIDSMARFRSLFFSEKRDATLVRPFASGA